MEWQVLTLQLHRLRLWTDQGRDTIVASCCVAWCCTLASLLLEQSLPKLNILVVLNLFLTEREGNCLDALSLKLKTARFYSFSLPPVVCVYFKLARSP